MPSQPGNAIDHWLSNFTDPPLSTLSNISNKCAVEENFFDVSLLEQKQKCAEILDSNKDSSFKLECLSEESLRVRLGRRPCTPADVGEALSRIRQAANSGSYIRSGQMLKPNGLLNPGLISNLFVIELQSEGETSLQHPTWANWLAQGQPSPGVMAMYLSYSSPSSQERTRRFSALNSLLAFLRAQTKPRYFPGFSPELINPMTQPELPAIKLNHSVALKYSGQDSIEKESCEYLDKWLQARLVLEGMDLRTAPLELNCHFEWNEGSKYSEPALLLAQLPLPLSTPDGAVFPIRTSEEARSLSHLQLLRSYIR